MTDEAKPYMSPSRIGLYAKCGEAYRRRYVEGDIIPPGVALLKGSGVHRGAEVNEVQKIETRKDLPTHEIVDAAVQGFKARQEADGLLLHDEEKKIGERKVVGAAIDRTALVAKAYAQKIAPTYQPKYVEVKHRIVMEKETHDLLGIVDTIDEENWIRDRKTSGKKKNQADVDGDLQFSFYALTYAAQYKKDPKGIVVDLMVDSGKGDVRTFAIKTQRTKRDYQNVVNRVHATLRGVKAGVFVPANTGAWWCAPKWCGYWATCSYVNAERKAAAEASK